MKKEISGHIRLVCDAALVLFLCFTVFSAAGKEESNSPVSYEFHLKPIKGETGLLISHEMGGKGTTFKKEPSFSGDKIIRNIIPLPGKPLPFAWDTKSAKLYLDFNRNLDLTDDPNSVFVPENPRSRTHFFQDLPIEVMIQNTPVLYHISLQLYNYRRFYENIEVKTSWEGEVDLPDIKARMNVTDNLNGEISFTEKNKGQDMCLFVPTDFKDHPSTYTVQSFVNRERFPVAGKIFLGGRAYKIDFAFVKPEKEVLLKATFREMKPETGILRFSGDYIKQAFLSGDYKLILFAPEREEAIPAGHYKECKISLQRNPSQIELSSTLEKNFSLKKNEVYSLMAGAPLKNKITVTRAGTRLNMNYDLTGIGGESYQKIDYQHPPEFAVYQNGKKIFSGKFAFG